MPKLFCCVSLFMAGPVLRGGWTLRRNAIDTGERLSRSVPA